MNRYLRRDVLMALALGLLSGCGGGPERRLPPEQPVAPEQNLDSLKLSIQRREARRTSLKLDCMVRLTTPSPELMTRGFTRGRIRFVRGPMGRQLRFNVSEFGSGVKLDMATDGRDIWIYNPVKYTKYQGQVGRYYDVASTPGPFPDDLAEIFDLSHIFDEKLTIFEKSPGAYQIQLVEVGQAGQLRLYRRMTIDRTDLSVVNYEIFNPDGSVRCQILMSDYQDKVPRRIRASWPSARALLEIRVEYVDVNKMIPPDTFAFSGKRRVSVVDLEGGMRPDYNPSLERRTLRQN